jgi:hypothetical protein
VKFSPVLQTGLTRASFIFQNLHFSRLVSCYEYVTKSNFPFRTSGPTPFFPVLLRLIPSYPVCFILHPCYHVTVTCYGYQLQPVTPVASYSHSCSVAYIQFPWTSVSARVSLPTSPSMSVPFPYINPSFS